jgi:hypothetical protein
MSHFGLCQLAGVEVYLHNFFLARIAAMDCISSVRTFTMKEKYRFGLRKYASLGSLLFRSMWWRMLEHERQYFFPVLVSSPPQWWQVFIASSPTIDLIFVPSPPALLTGRRVSQQHEVRLCNVQ